MPKDKLKRVGIVLICFIIISIIIYFGYSIYLNSLLNPIDYRDDGENYFLADNYYYSEYYLGDNRYMDSINKNYISPESFIYLCENSRKFIDRKKRSIIFYPGFKLIHGTKYSVCFEGYSEPIKLEVKPYSGDMWFIETFSGVRYKVQLKDKPIPDIDGKIQGQDKYLPLTKIDTFPKKMEIIKGNNCFSDREKVLKSYLLSISNETSKYGPERINVRVDIIK